MDFLIESLLASLSLIVSLDRDLYWALWTSMYVAAFSIIFAALLGIPIGLAVGLGDFPLKRQLVTFLNSLMAIPTVLIGLLVYGFLSRQGPMGQWGLLYTPGAIIIGDTILAAPIVASLTLSSVQGADRRILPTAMTLGAGPFQSIAKFISEIRFGIMAAVIAGFSRVVSEVGVAIMLGGNIRGYTRTMTTTIALETTKGEFALGIGLGIILMAVVLIVNIFLNLVQQR